MTSFKEFQEILLDSRIDVVSKEKLEQASKHNELYCQGKELGRVVILTGLAIIDCLRRMK